MDKPGNSVHYQVPLTRNAGPTSIGDVREADASQARSFEVSLERLKNETAARKQTESVVLDQSASAEALGGNDGPDGSVDSDSEFSDNRCIEFPDEATQTIVPVADESVHDTPLATSVQSLFGNSSASRELHLSDSANVSAESGIAGIPGVNPIEAQTVNAGISGSGSSTISGPVSAESVASLMLRLERSAGVHNGTWNFSVLNNAMGVVALQLQRSLQGSWRIGVSVAEDTGLEDTGQVGELMQTLRAQGYDIDSVTVNGNASELVPYG